MKKRRRLLCSALLAGAMLIPSGAMPVSVSADNGVGSAYTAPASGTVTYNMNLDWRFLLPSQSDTLPHSLESSKDSSGKYFFEADYNETGVAGAGYYDAHGVLVEGAEWTTVSIPHSITGLQAFAHYAVDAGERGATRCCLLYRKEITVPEGEKFIFELEGIRQAAYVWVNGREVGYYEAGIAAMGFDISGYVTPGETAVIAVAEDGTTSRGATEFIKESLPKEPLSSTDAADENRGAFNWQSWGLRDGQGFQWNTSDFNEVQLGLIYDAYLHVSGKVYQTRPLYNNMKTTGNYIYADNFDIKGKTATINVDAEIRNESGSDKALVLEVDVVDPDGKLAWTFESSKTAVKAAEDAGVVYATTVKKSAYDTDAGGAVIGDDVTTWETVEVTHITASYEASGVRFWNVDDPYLYDIYTVLKDEDGTVLDVQKKTTGFRKVSYSIEDGLEINDRYVWLPGYAQRSTDEWAVIGSANDWMNDYDMELLRESNAKLVRWMHVAPKPAQIRSSDKYGVVSVCPAGDKEADSSNRSWSLRAEAMRDAIIYFRNSPSVLFYESGNNKLNTAHSKEMLRIKTALDPNGGRFIGSRSLQTAEPIQYSEYAGTMLGNYGSKAKEAMDLNGQWGPIMETEYVREEAPRRVWDDYSPPDYDYVNKYLGSGAKKTERYDIWDLTQEALSLRAVDAYAGFYNNRVGGANGTDIYSAAAMMVWSDSNQHTRNSGTENCRTSGRVDPIRQIKNSFYAVQALQSDDATVRILGHWSYPEVSDATYNYYEKSAQTVGSVSYEVYDTSKKLKRDPTKKTVYVVGSADVARVDLYRIDGNEETLLASDRTPTSTFLYEFENIDVTKGDAVKAVAYNAKDIAVAEHEIERTYDAYSLRLTPVTSDAGWAADGADIAFFDVEVLDKNGNVCALNYDKINLSYSGEGTFLGGYNGGTGEGCFQHSEGSEGISFYFGGSKDGTSTIHKDYVYAECGTNRIFVKSTRNAGSFTLNASLCDAEGNPTAIAASASVTSHAVPVAGGLTTAMPAAQSYTYADSAPELESVPSMVLLSKIHKVDWDKVELIERTDDTVYYTVSLNGTELTLTPRAYEGLSESVFGPMLPVLDELKKLGANVEYTYDAETDPDDPKLTVYVNKGTDDYHVLWCHPSENNLFVDADSNLCNDSPCVKDDAFCFEFSMILGYIQGVTTSQNTEAKTYTINYSGTDADISINVTPSSGGGGSSVSVTNQPESSVMYAAKYDNDGRLVAAKRIASGDALDFVPDKVFVWTEEMQPIKVWTNE